MVQSTTRPSPCTNSVAEGCGVVAGRAGAEAEGPRPGWGDGGGEAEPEAVREQEVAKR